MAANERYFDAAVRHAIGVRRFAGSEVKDVLRILDESDAAIQARILRTRGAFTKTRLQLLQKDLRALRAETFKAIRANQRASLFEFAKAEQEFSQGLVRTVLPVDIQFAAAEARTLQALVTTQPFSGGVNAANTLQGWWSGVQAADARRIRGAINLGVAQAETIPQIAGRVRDVYDVTRRNAEAITRTAVNHVSNGSRELFFKENKDVFELMMWASTLDGRTTAVCRARDGHYTAVSDAPADKIPDPKLQPAEARPPAHVQCRSLMIGILSPKGLAGRVPDRPFVRDTRTRRQREIDFRAQAKQNAGSRWKGMDRQQRNNAVKKQKLKWSREVIGQVPGKVSYDRWLRRQPTAFQNEVLGVKKAKAFRKGLRMDQFIDRRGSELNLKQLRKRFPEFVAGA